MGNVFGDELLTVEEVSTLIKKKPGFVYKNWHKWESNGLRVLRAGSHPRFYRSDILKMMEAKA